MDKKLIQQPPNMEEDMLVNELVATYLSCNCKKKNVEMNAFPLAFRLVHSLETYRMDRDLEKLTKNLNLPLETLRVYQRQQEKKAQA